MVLVPRRDAIKSMLMERLSAFGVTAEPTPACSHELIGWHGPSGARDQLLLCVCIMVNSTLLADSALSPRLRLVQLVESTAYGLCSAINARAGHGTS